MTTPADTVAQTAAVLGTASYLSPEQAQGQPVDGRSDIYSLGCVIYEMLTGRPPFLGDSPVTVASKQVLEQPAPPSKLNTDVSPDLDAVVLRAMAKNPANRYQSGEELRADLERVRRGLPVQATPLLGDAAATQAIAQPQPTAVLPPAEPERSRWWIPVLVTLLILGILALALWFLAQNLLQDEEEPTLVPVPNVVGETRRQAETILVDAGLAVGDVIQAPAPADDPEVEPGTVIEQDPAAEEEVEEGTEVTLTVVAQPDQVEVPTIPEGSTVEQATAALIGAGLTPAASTVEEPSDVDEGLVVGTDPPAGTLVDPASEVAIVVSSGPELVTVPDVRCRSANAAQNALENAGLQGIISSQTVAENPNCPLGNKVADQSPAAGGQVEPGTTVTLFFGEAAEPTGPTGGTAPTGGTGATGDED
jgi:serine/threonine-protein kinase